MIDGIGERNRKGLEDPVTFRFQDNDLISLLKLIGQARKLSSGKLPSMEQEPLFYNTDSAQPKIKPSLVSRSITLTNGAAVVFTFDEENEFVTPVLNNHYEPLPQRVMHGIHGTFITPVYNSAPGQDRFTTPFGSTFEGGTNITAMGGGGNVFRIDSDDDYYDIDKNDTLITLPDGMMSVWVQGFDDGSDGNRRYYIIDSDKFQLYYEYNSVGPVSRLVWKPNTDFPTFNIMLDIASTGVGGWFGYTPTKLRLFWDYQEQIFEMYYGDQRAALEPPDIITMPLIMGKRMSMGNSLRPPYYSGGDENAYQHFNDWTFSKLKPGISSATSVDGQVMQSLVPLHKGDFVVNCGDSSTPINLGTSVEPYDNIYVRNITTTCSYNGVTPWEATGTIDILSSFDTFIEQNIRNLDENMHGVLQVEATGATLDFLTPVIFNHGIGRIYLVVNSAADSTGSITVTGNTVDRDTGVVTPADTEVITIAGLSTDNSAPDVNGNIIYDITDGYITTKWFQGTVTLTTADVNISDLDVYHTSYEQFDDTEVEIKTFDINVKTTSALGWFHAYLYEMRPTAGNKADITNLSTLQVLVADTVANEYYRLRESGLDVAIDGTAGEGIWVDVFFGPTPQTIWEDFTMKVWFTTTQEVATIPSDPVLWKRAISLITGQGILTPKIDDSDSVEMPEGTSTSQRFPQLGVNSSIITGEVVSPVAGYNTEYTSIDQGVCDTGVVTFTGVDSNSMSRVGSNSCCCEGVDYKAEITDKSFIGGITWSIEISLYIDGVFDTSNNGFVTEGAGGGDVTAVFTNGCGFSVVSSDDADEITLGDILEWDVLVRGPILARDSAGDEIYTLNNCGYFNYSNPPRARMTFEGNQIGVASVATLEWDTETFDSDGNMVNLASDQMDIIANGYYLVRCTTAIESATLGDRFTLRARIVGGATLSQVQNTAVFNAVPVDPSCLLQLVDLYSLTRGQSVEFVIVAPAGTFNINNSQCFFHKQS